MHLLPVNALTHWLHSLTHRLRCALSPAYADEAALARDQDTLEFLTECHANDWAADLRARGYDCPPGTVLAGVTVTR